MPAPINTYNSKINLNLGQVPPSLPDPLYTELLDLHNAIERLVTWTDLGDSVAAAYIAKQRNVITTNVDYTVKDTDGTVLVDASSGPVTITLHPIDGKLGYRYNIKRIDSVPTNAVVLQGDGTEYVDGKTSGIKVSTGSCYTVIANTLGWSII